MMRQPARTNHRGRRLRLPSFLYLPPPVAGLLQSADRFDRGVHRSLLTALLCLAVWISAFGAADAQFRQRRPYRAPAPPHRISGNARLPRPSVERPDPAALDLLKRMLRPDVSFSGIQRTQVGNRVSEQKYEGDEKGRRRLEYLSPAALSGDVVLILPNAFYYYHAHTSQMGIALWPIGQTEQKLRGLIQQIQRGAVSIARTGQEQILGHDCAILTLFARRPAVAALMLQGKLWIDTVSGVLMRYERWNARGLVSVTYMTTIVTGPEAGVVPADFLPRSLPKAAQAEAVFPPEKPPLTSVAMAKVSAPFLMEPGRLPDGYALDGVWIFGGGPAHPERASALLRYTRGVSHISLFERRANPGQIRRIPAATRASAANVQRWQAANAQGESVDLIYIGNLGREEVQLLRDTMR